MSSVQRAGFPERLDSFDKLQQALGSQFVIFCGSAVSGFPVHHKQQVSRFLPMVWDSIDWFLSELASHLRNQGGYEETVAAYAEALVGGKNLFIRFEDFLWQLQHVLGSDEDAEKAVKSFLKDLFMCDKNQFGPNHAAIANLMDTGRALACLTTNFDNAIEQAMQGVTVDPDKRVHPDNVPNLQEFEKGICLLKLHGDVEKNIYRATTSALMLGEQGEEYRYVETLLGRRTVLVLGYSGDGDIDISPYLLKPSGIELIWVVKEDVPPPHAKSYFVSDLHSFNPDKNCLLKLAGYQGDQVLSDWPDWKERANRWFQNTDLNLLQRIIPRLLQDRPTWSILHLHHVYQWNAHDRGDPVDDTVVELNRGIACISAGIYFSGLWILCMVKQSLSDKFNFSQIYFWRGFANWRLGFFNKARTNLNLSLTYFDDATNNTSGRVMPSTGVFDYSPTSRTEIMRVRLETYRDELAMYRSYQKRKEVYQAWELDKEIADFQSPEIEDAQQRLLGDLVILDIRYLLGESINIDDVLGICNRSYNLDNHHVAPFAAQLLLRIDHQKGREWIEQITREKLRKDTLSAVQNAAISKETSFLSMWPYSLHKYTNIVLKFFVVMSREMKFLRERRKWQAAFLKQKIICVLKPDNDVTN